MNNEPAFPAIGIYNPAQKIYYTGMTLRDYFAAKAMQIMWDAYDKGYCGLDSENEMSANDIANASYQLADEMMKARGK